MMELEFSKLRDFVVDEDELKAYFNIKTRRLYQWVRAGLPFCQVNPTRKYFLIKDIINFLEKNRIVDKVEGETPCDTPGDLGRPDWRKGMRSPNPIGRPPEVEN
jgi:hypothetical protein